MTDNGTHFTDPKGNSRTASEVKRLIAEKARFRCRGFDLACAQNDIDHRLTKPGHPWSLRDQDLIQWVKFPENDQVERMNRTIKAATVRRYHYESHERLRDHLGTFMEAYDFAKRLKSLKGRTVFEFITEKWTSEPDRFRVHLNHLIPGPKI